MKRSIFKGMTVLIFLAFLSGCAAVDGSGDRDELQGSEYTDGQTSDVQKAEDDYKTDYIDMEEFGLEREEWLRTFLELPNGIPDSDTFRRLFERINPKELSECLYDWLNMERDKRSVVAIVNIPRERYHRSTVGYRPSTDAYRGEHPLNPA